MKKKMSIILFSISVLLTSVFCAYAHETMTVETVTFTDDLQREVTVPVPLTSVVTLAPSLTETLAYLGAEDLITAVDINSDFPESISELPRITGWDMSVNYEELTALEPDLVLEDRRVRQRHHRGLRTPESRRGSRSAVGRSFRARS